MSRTIEKKRYKKKDSRYVHILEYCWYIFEIAT